MTPHQINVLRALMLLTALRTSAQGLMALHQVVVHEDTPLVLNPKTYAGLTLVLVSGMSLSLFLAAPKAAQTNTN